MANKIPGLMHVNNNWLVVSTALIMINMKVSWDDYSQ